MWEILSPGITPFQIPALGSLQLYFDHMFYLLVGSKSVRRKMFEIKYKKDTSLWGRSAAANPAKRGLERTIIELIMLNFRPGAERALSAHRAD